MIRFAIFITIILLLLPSITYGVPRFPPPEFETGHELPVPTVPSPRSDFLEYTDVVVLLVTLILASYLALKKRTRRGLLLLSIFSLIYFGFWRNGCICPIGAIQNISLALFNKSYIAPITAIAFFILPLAFTLFFGRTFCASVCPLGAIQDIFVIRPIKVPYWLENSLGLLPYLYLGAGVLFSATGSAFIICEYDPFVSFFRRSGRASILILGACFLLIGMFVGRPYCRFLCPYSVLLRLMSLASKWHVRITPSECIKCRLCEDSCPFGAIRKPTQEKPKDKTLGKKAFTLAILIMPLLIVVGAYLGVRSGTTLSHVNPKVRLAERVWLEDNSKVGDTTDASVAFRGSGRAKEELYSEVIKINERFAIASGIFGGFVGLVISAKMIQLFIRRKRLDYEADRSQCFSCGRCFAYCPVVKSKGLEHE
jgi:NosR/NirI family nitrous oxide reductase transcriptional regulator